MKTSEPSAPSAGLNHPPPAPPAAGRRKRTYSPRTSGKEKNNPLVIQKKAELRDARILSRLVAESRELTPWGLGQLKEAIKEMGPVQPPLLKTD